MVDTGFQVCGTIHDDGYPYWTTEPTTTNLGSSDNSYAVTPNNNRIAIIGNFGFSLPSTAVIDGIEVEIESKNSVATTKNYTVGISYNSGTSWVSKSDSVAETEQIDTLGGSADTWGRSWSYSEFDNGVFRLRMQTTSGTGSWSVDRVRVKIYYTDDAILIEPNTQTIIVSIPTYLVMTAILIEPNTQTITSSITSPTINIVTKAVVETQVLQASVNTPIIRAVVSMLVNTLSFSASLPAFSIRSTIRLSVQSLSLSIACGSFKVRAWEDYKIDEQTWNLESPEDTAYLNTTPSSTSFSTTNPSNTTYLTNTPESSTQTVFIPAQTIFIPEIPSNSVWD
jgi:hypothetical protein